MRHKLVLPTLAFALLTCQSVAVAQGNEWIVFASRVITPRPLTWQTDDWNNYKEAKDVPFRDYTFEYPKRWSFTGYSVFNDDKERKVAEIAPGVIALAPNRKCFDNAKSEAPGPIRIKAFQLGRVGGRLVTSDVVFHDSPEKFRVYSYCVQENGYAFLVTFLERKGQPQMSNVFRRVVRSFRFVSPASPETKP